MYLGVILEQHFKIIKINKFGIPGIVHTLEMPKFQTFKLLHKPSNGIWRLQYKISIGGAMRSSTPLRKRRKVKSWNLD